VRLTVTARQKKTAEAADKAATTVFFP